MKLKIYKFSFSYLQSWQFFYEQFSKTTHRNEFDLQKSYLFGFKKNGILILIRYYKLGAQTKLTKVKVINKYTDKSL